MKIATYNIWNHPSSFEVRLGAICEELVKVDSDLIALQEVPLTMSESSDQLFLDWCGKHEFPPSDHYGVIVEVSL